MSSEADSRGVADTSRELRQVRDGLLPAEAENVDQAIRDGVESVARLVDETAVGELRGEMQRIAHEIRLLGTGMTAAREDATDAAAHILGHVADELEATLRPAEAGPEPALSTLAITTPGTSAPSPAPRLTCTVADAQRLHSQRPRDQQAVRRPVNQVIAKFPPKLQGLARTLLTNRSSHAVQRHGHHLTPEHQLARLQWLLDPAFIDQWQANDDGSITSQRRNGRPHAVDAVAGNYTSPEAVAKPLVAILTAAGRTQQALDTYLDRLADGGTLVRLFLPPDTTGIATNDVFMARGVGSDTNAGQKVWKTTREGALAGYGDPPAARSHDAVTQGVRPGSLVIFAKGATTNWRLITSFFTDDPDDTPYTEL